MKPKLTFQPNQVLLDSETFKTYQFVIKRYQRITNRPLTMKSLAEHLNQLRQLDYSGATIALDYQTLSKAIIERAPISMKAKLIQERRELHRAFVFKDTVSYRNKSLSPEHIQKLIDKADWRLALIIRFLAETGVRISELCNLRWTDLDMLKSNKQTNYFRIKGKSNKHRMVFVEAELIQKIKMLFKGQMYVFQTVRGNSYNRTYVTRKIGELSLEVLGKKINSHTFRHSFVTNEIKAGTAIDAISRFVGHSSIAFTVTKYAHNELTPEMKSISYCNEEYSHC